MRNAFRPLTVKEMIQALADARYDDNVGVIILTGEGDKAFCAGGDQKVRGDYGGYQDDSGVHHLNVLDFQRQIRTCPKPVVAMVAGYSIGGGHVLHMMCDLTIAAENAIFGQTRKSAPLTAVGALRIWRVSLVRRKRVKSGSCAASTMRNRRWIWGWLTPSFRWRIWKRDRALVPRNVAKQSDGAALPESGAECRCDGQAGLQELAGNATMLFYMTEEGQEGRNAFNQKRQPDFSKFKRNP